MFVHTELRTLGCSVGTKTSRFVYIARSSSKHILSIRVFKSLLWFRCRSSGIL